MKNDENILTRLAHRDGLTVPEGYFADFARSMEAALPDRPELAAASPVAPRSWWQRLRPYTYMAAMFAGVWCMLKLFAMLTSSSPLPLETNPVIAEAFSNAVFVNEYVIPELNEWDLYDDLMEDGIDPAALLDSVSMSTPSSLSITD